MRSNYKSIVQILLQGGTIANCGVSGLRLRDNKNTPVGKVDAIILAELTLKKVLRRVDGLYSIKKRKVQQLHGNNWIKQEYKRQRAGMLVVVKFKNRSIRQKEAKTEDKTTLTLW